MKWLKIAVELKRTVALAVPVPDDIGEDDTVFLNALAGCVVRRADGETNWADLDSECEQTAAVDAVTLLAADKGPARTYSSSLYYEYEYLRKLDAAALLSLYEDDTTPPFVRSHVKNEVTRRGLPARERLRTLEATVLYKNGTWEKRYEQVDEPDDAIARSVVHDRLSKCPSVDGVQVGAFVPGPPPAG